MKSQVVLLCSTLVWSIAVPAQVRLNNSNKVERIKNANEIRLSSPQITNLKNQFDVGVSEFYFASQSISDPDCKGAHCWVWSYETSVWRNLDKDTNNKDWTEMVFWRKIPKTAVYGKFEISTSPFSGNDDTIVQSGIVETNGQNELKFNIPYSVSNERKSTPKPGDQVTRVKPGENQEIKLSNVYKNLIKNNQSPIVNPVYFVRITPLDASKNPIGISSNSISLTQVLYKFYNPPKITYDRYKDYVITGINYVPVQQPNGNFMGCNIVTSYNPDYFGNSPVGINFARDFQKAFPIGSMICPDHSREESSWYEKAFNGVTGFAISLVNGAAEFYNSSKNYVKGEIASSVCSVAPSGVQSECEFAAGAAFDGAMIAAGIPPSLPNTDDLIQMAEGQIVDLACDQIEQQYSFPIPEYAREKVKNEFHQELKNSASKGTVNCGFLNVKPHPESQFRTAYLVIEVTKVSNRFPDTKNIVFSIENQSERKDIYCENCSPGFSSNTLKFNQFEEAIVRIPNLENVGDKTKILVVLKPQESWVDRDPKTNKIRSIGKPLPYNEFVTPVSPTYEGATHSDGFYTLNTKSQLTFKISNLKIADGVNTVFNQP